MYRSEFILVGRVVRGIPYSFFSLIFQRSSSTNLDAQVTEPRKICRYVGIVGNMHSVHVLIGKGRVEA